MWAGKIHEPGHELHGLEVYLSQQDSEWTGEGRAQVFGEGHVNYVSGCAHISPRPAKPPTGGEPIAPPVWHDGMKPHEQLLMMWATSQHEYSRIVTHGEAEVNSLARHYGVSLPEDFRAYLLHACSTLDDGGQMDDFSNAWWGLERIRSVAEEYSLLDTSSVLARSPDKWLFFADTAIWCTAWAICCLEGPDFGRICIAGSGDRVVADSFAQFIDAYLRDDRAIY